VLIGESPTNNSAQRFATLCGSLALAIGVHVVAGRWAKDWFPEAARLMGINLPLNIIVSFLKGAGSAPPGQRVSTTECR
jgi:hypothetical protein